MSGPIEPRPAHRAPRRRGPPRTRSRYDLSGRFAPIPNKVHALVAVDRRERQLVLNKSQQEALALGKEDVSDMAPILDGGPDIGGRARIEAGLVDGRIVQDGCVPDAEVADLRREGERAVVGIGESALVTVVHGCSFALRRMSPHEVRPRSTRRPSPNAAGSATGISYWDQMADSGVEATFAPRGG